MRGYYRNKIIEFNVFKKDLVWIVSLILPIPRLAPISAAGIRDICHPALYLDLPLVGVRRALHTTSLLGPLRPRVCISEPEHFEQEDRCFKRILKSLDFPLDNEHNIV